MYKRQRFQDGSKIRCVLACLLEAILLRFGGLSWPIFGQFSMPVSVLSSTWFLTRFSTFYKAMFQVKLGAKNEQKPWRVCNFYDFRRSASEPLPSAFGELFWSRFGRQDGPKIDPKAHPEPTPKTTLQKDPKPFKILLGFSATLKSLLRDS